MAFTRSLGSATPDNGIRVDGINPGPVLTWRLQNFLRKRPHDRRRRVVARQVVAVQEWCGHVAGRINDERPSSMKDGRSRKARLLVVRKCWGRVRRRRYR
jgi:NAD(P)-dependent dehydrogenase (short-subunit alcohol dehydrogenase family)